MYSVPLPLHARVAERFREALERYGPDAGGAIVPRLLEEDLQSPLRSYAPEAFRGWTYAAMDLPQVAASERAPFPAARVIVRPGSTAAGASISPSSTTSSSHPPSLNAGPASHPVAGATQVSHTSHAGSAALSSAEARVAAHCPPNHDELDVLVVGAGVLGISAAYHLRSLCPSLTYAVLEKRASVGGTWDQWRYPGVRSDVDMHSYSFRWRPWDRSDVFGSGEAIMDYLHDSIDAFNLRKHVRLDHAVTAAEYCSDQRRWTLTTAQGQVLRSKFLLMGAGYFEYEGGGYVPPFVGMDAFRGRVVHPQAWPDGLDCTGKRVIVIGSGASAVSLVPALAKRAARVTMVQRSPSYIVPKRSTPSLLVQRLRALAPALAGRLSFWSYVVWDAAIYFGCHLFPSAARATLLRTSASLLDGGRGLEHFTPRYGPWKQRMCWDPDGGFHELYRTGAIDIVTGVIHSFTEGGVRVESSVDDETHDVAADIVVAATGYNHGHNYPMQKIRVSIDGKPYNAGETKCECKAHSYNVHTERVRQYARACTLASPMSAGVRTLTCDRLQGHHAVRCAKLCVQRRVLSSKQHPRCRPRA